MNPYEPPRGEIRPSRLSTPFGRTPAERAFDWVFLRLLVILPALAFSANLPTFVKAIVVAAVAAHWGYGVVKLFQSWRDPAGKTLRFATAALLLLEAFALFTSMVL